MKTKQDNIIDLSFIEDLEWREIVKDWSEYHKEELHKPYKQRGIRSFYSMLMRISDGDIEKAKLIIEQSQANTWVGIFPLRQEYGQGTNRAGSQRKTDYQEQFANVIARKMGN